MKTELSDINTFTKKFLVNVPIKTYKTLYDKVLNKTSKKLQLPGFRKGKIPKEFVRKRYHDSIHADTLDQLIQKTFSEACDENNIYPLGNLHVSKLDYNDKTGLKYTIQFEVKPELKNIVYTDLVLEQETDSVDDNEVQKTIEQLLLEYSTFEELEKNAKIKNTSYIQSNIQQLDAGEKKMKGHFYRNVRIQIGEGKFDKNVEKKLIGLAKGDKKIVKRYYPKNYKIKDIAGKSEIYEFEITKIEERFSPKLDEDFIARLNDKKLKTVNDLENQIRKNMEHKIKTAEEQSLIANAVKVLLSKNTIEIPTSMLNNYLDRLVEDAQKERGINEKKFRSARKDSAADELRWQLIRDYIIKKEGIEIATGIDGESELSNYISSLSMSEKEITFFKENEQMRNSLKYQLLNKKFIDILIQKNKIKKIKLSKN